MSKAKEVSKTNQELSAVCQSDIVFSHPGDEVVLSCHLEPAVSAASMEIQWWHKIEDLVLHYKDGRVTVNIDFEDRVSLSLENLLNGNVSLTLRDVRISQKGLYICEVIHESQSIQDTVFLHVSSVDFSLAVPFNKLSADPGSDVILPVHLSPETSAVSMDIRWFKGAELIYQYNNGQEMTNNDYENRVSLSIQELERGNLALTLRNIQQSDSGDYKCKVFHDGCQKRGVVHLQVREIEIVNHLHSVLKKAHEDITQQKTKLNETIKLIEETLNLVDATYPRRSMEGVPPLMKGECGSIRTIQPREESTATQQEISSPYTPSQVLQRVRRSEILRLTERAAQTQQSPEETTQSTQERREETIVTEQERSSPAVQHEREGTSQSHSAQTEGRGQRRREKRERKCHIL